MASVAKEWREIPGRYNLEGSKCPCCGKVFFPQREMCPECRRESLGKMESYDVCREGGIFSFSIVYDAPDFNNRIKPYAVAMVKTADGIMIPGQVVDVDLDKICIGMPVRAVLRRIGADGASGVIRYGYKFVPRK